MWLAIRTRSLILHLLAFIILHRWLISGLSFKAFDIDLQICSENSNDTILKFRLLVSFCLLKIRQQRLLHHHWDLAHQSLARFSLLLPCCTILIASYTLTHFVVSLGRRVCNRIWLRLEVYFVNCNWSFFLRFWFFFLTQKFRPDLSNTSIISNGIFWFSFSRLKRLKDWFLSFLHTFFRIDIRQIAWW